MEIEVKQLTDEELIYLSFLIEKEIKRRIQNDGSEAEEQEEKEDN